MSAAEQAAHEEALKRIAECARRRRSVLDLSGLGLTRVPSRALELVILTELNLANNQLVALPPELGDLANLTRLNLAGNRLVALPPELGALAGLAVLDISHNPLGALPPEIGGLGALTRLDVSHTSLVAVPPELGNLARLTRLYLTHTHVAELPVQLGQLAGLTRLYLEHNRLAALPAGIGQLANLTRLDVSHNRLSQLPAELGQLAKLTVLDLSGNRLEALPPELGQLAKLTVLGLAGNRLGALPEPLRDLENLESLWLHDNPGLQLSPSVLGADPRAVGTAKGGQNPRLASAKSILEFYFARLTGKTQPLNEVKLVVVGPGAAGKTSVVQALRDLPFREREVSTAGVALCDWPMDGCPGGLVTAHVWDFSGQAIPGLLHPKFFTAHAIYVLVLTGRERRERADADSWLRLLHAHASDAQGQGPPVIVVLNQWNVPNCRAELDRALLRESHPFIRGFVEMDCKGKKGVAVLKSLLCREFERMPWLREPFPEEWHAVRRALTAGPPRLTEESYRALCASHAVIDQGQQDYLADITHQLGSSLNDRSDPRLHEAAALRPDWFTKHLYALLHRAHHRAGLLEQADLAIALHSESDPTQRAYLMQSLERFAIARPADTPTGPAWLVPSLLPEAPPANFEPFPADADAYQLRFTYPQMPDDLPVRLMLRRQGFVEEVREQKLQWRHGLVLIRKGARALVRAIPDDRQLTITVIGPRRAREAFAGLCQAEMRAIHEEIPGLDPLEQSFISRD